MPVDRGTLDAQLREIGEGDGWWEQREFRDLPYILHPGERILGIANGRVRGPRRFRMRSTARWLIVATDQRLICVRRERFGRKQVDIALDSITRIQQSSRIRSWQIAVETPEGRYRIRIPKAQAFRFSGALAALMPKPSVSRLSPDLEPLSWIPGITTVAALPGFAGIVSKVSMLSPPEYTPRRQVERLEATVERLQAEVEQLQQQVGFLEDLLQKRADEVLLPPSPMDS